MPDASETESASRSRPTDRGPSVADAVRQSRQSLAEVTQYIAYLLSAKLDQVKLTVRTLILYAVLGVMAVVAASTLLIVSVVLLFTGAAHGLGMALGGRDWLGELIVGAATLGAIALAAGVLLSRFKTASRRRTMRKYDERRKEQREQFGHDVAQRAAQ